MALTTVSMERSRMRDSSSSTPIVDGRSAWEATGSPKRRGLGRYWGTAPEWKVQAKRRPELGGMRSALRRRTRSKLGQTAGSASHFRRTLASRCNSLQLSGLPWNPQRKGPLIMHRPLRPAALLATLAILSLGCGHKPKPEMPEPVSQEETPQQTETPATPSQVSDESASPKELNDAQRAALEERIAFDFDRSDLSAAAREKLSAKAEILRGLPDLSVRVEGHADERGSDEYNLALSNRRAAADMRHLM